MTTAQLLKEITEIEANLDRLNRPSLAPTLNYAAGILAEDARQLRRELGLRTNCFRCNNNRLRINGYGKQYCLNCGVTQ